MEGSIARLGGEHDDRQGLEVKIYRITHRRRRSRPGKVDVGDLRGRVHAGIGSPRSMNDETLVAEPEQGVFENLLNGPPVVLALPTNER